MLKTCLIVEVLRLIRADFGTASAIQIISKYPFYRHLPPMMEKQVRESFSSDWPIIAKASCLPSSE